MNGQMTWQKALVVMVCLPLFLCPVSNSIPLYLSPKMILKLFHFRLFDFLLWVFFYACMLVDHVCSFYLWLSEGVGFLGTGVMDGCDHHLNVADNGG